MQQRVQPGQLMMSYFPNCILALMCSYSRSTLHHAWLLSACRAQEPCWKQAVQAILPCIVFHFLLVYFVSYVVATEVELNFAKDAREQKADYEHVRGRG